MAVGEAGCNLASCSRCCGSSTRFSRRGQLGQTLAEIHKFRKSSLLTFSEELLIDPSVDANAVVQCQTGVECEAVEVFSWVQVDGTHVGIFVHVFDRHTALQINKRHIALNSRAVQSSGCHLASAFARIVPGRGTDREPLAARDHAVERVQHWPRDQGRLVGDPEMLDGFKRVGPDDPAVSQTSLEDRPTMILCPFGADPGMVLTQLQKVPE